ncbi:DUF6716 putative glycosyltransferase [Otariodibacter oris]|uniref:Uncharacterized protein n=1 Tax=Otariodibacter oris TaxID=1032623 RepID=A0A420XGG5_9PAST|nr:DUF6716 putative glycosyltransferase [Otariodibacter oris]QGM80110.1 hypothetical protein A6A10_01125 [Otariodibacter oris]RKR71937.1 hypothetical protein DES31_1290 [Otariodibacter oris]
MKKILIIVTYDSFLKAGINIASRLKGFSIDVAIQNVKKNQLSLRQLNESKIANFNIVELNFSTLDQYNIVMLSMGNSSFRKFIVQYYDFFSNTDLHRPLLISIFPGVIFGQVDSIISRINSDIVIANNQADVELIEKMARTYNNNLKVLNYGIVNINQNFLRERNRNKEENIVFIDQVRIPNLYHEREYVVDNLIELAKSNPEKNIIIKTRVNAKEITVHIDKYPYFDILKHKVVPSNLYISSESIDSLYHKMDFCISFSSTVIFEALYYGIPCGVIKDLGIREDFSNKYFLDSGLLMSFSEIKAGIRRKVDINWFDNYVVFDHDRDKVLQELIDSSLKNKQNENMSISSEPLFCGAFRDEYNKELKVSKKKSDNMIFKFFSKIGMVFFNKFKF